MKLPENVSESVRRRNPELYGSEYNADGLRLRPAKPERTEGMSLEHSEKGKSQSGVGIAGRTRIIFRVFSQRPLDWDNYRLKDLQDCLRHAGLLDGDDWNQLQGAVISEKAHSKAEERTVIEIEAL